MITYHTLCHLSSVAWIKEGNVCYTTLVTILLHPVILKEKCSLSFDWCTLAEASSSRCTQCASQDMCPMCGFESVCLWICVCLECACERGRKKERKKESEWVSEGERERDLQQLRLDPLTLLKMTYQITHRTGICPCPWFTSNCFTVLCSPGMQPLHSVWKLN